MPTQKNAAAETQAVSKRSESEEAKMRYRASNK